MAKRSIKKGMRRMGVDNSKDFKTMQDAAMAAGGPKMIVGDDKMREEKCLAEIDKACSAYDCFMVAEVTVGGATGILSQVKIQAKPRTAPVVK